VNPWDTTFFFLVDFLFLGELSAIVSSNDGATVSYSVADTTSRRLYPDQIALADTRKEPLHRNAALPEASNQSRKCRTP
jgi:hypothetical protein